MGFCKRKNITCDIANTDWETTCNSLGCFQGIPDETVGKIKIIEHNFSPKDCITGIVDTETNGKRFAIGTKNNATKLVLNFGNKSCLLFTGGVMPIDLRQFNFDEFTSIEINGNRFVKEDNND